MGYKLLKIVYRSQETLKFLNILWLWPILDDLPLVSTHLEAIFHQCLSKNGTESTLILIFSGFRWRSCSTHLSRKLITFSLNFSYFVAKTKTSSAIFTTPCNPSTMFHIHFSKISVALLRPMAGTL